MAQLLLIETATEVCSVALAAGGRLVALAEDTQPARHAARLTLLIEDCLRQGALVPADLDAVAVSRGPGSYTGLRVGISAAKGLCYALDKPLIAVDTLLALATASLPDAADHDCLLLPMLDARRQEVWTALYDTQLKEVLPAQALVFENNLFLNFFKNLAESRRERTLIVSGNGGFKFENVPAGWEAVTSPVEKCSAKHLLPAATKIFQKRDFQDVAYFEPFYMKLPNITVPKKSV